MNNNPWKVMKVPVGDKFIWQVYRLRRLDEPMHSGNIETTRAIYTTAEAAEADAERRNKDNGTSNRFDG